MEGEEKEILQIMNDKMEKCFLCNSDEAYIKQEGIFLCSECFFKQKQAVLNLYMNKPILNPSYNKITPKIFLGNEDTARDKKILNEIKISNILICAEGCEKFFPDDFEYKILYIDDAVDEDLLSWLKEAFDFIDSSKNNIYIHCAMGISRSPSIVIAYIMYKEKISYENAFNKVYEKRNCINPNTGFRKQLQIFEDILIKNNFILPEKLSYLKE